MPGISWPFIMMCLFVELTPGPNMSYLALVSIIHGQRAGIAMVGRIAVGLLTIGIIAAFGANIIISQSAILYEILRWGGILYLGWLAWQAWRSGKMIIPEVPVQSDFFYNGLITNLLNPKAMIFYVVTIPIFINVNKNILEQTILLTIAYVTIATAVHIGITFLSARIGTTFNNANWVIKTRRIFAFLLAVTAIWLAIVTKR